MYTLSIKGKIISIFPSLEVNVPVIYLNTFSNEGQKVFEAAQAAGCPLFTLVAISDLDWNHDIVPWDNPPAFKNAEPCTGGADDYLRLLTEEIIPTAEKEINGVPRWRGIAGYSLAGLFALYAIYRTALFSRVGSISGSLWFPGIAFQIPEELFQRIKTHLARETARTGVKLTQRDFVLGLIERALAEAEASLAPQEAPESTEEAPEDSGAAGTTPDASEASAEAERDTADIEQ